MPATISQGAVIIRSDPHRNDDLVRSHIQSIAGVTPKASLVEGLTISYERLKVVEEDRVPLTLCMPDRRIFSVRLLTLIVTSRDSTHLAAICELIG